MCWFPFSVPSLLPPLPPVVVGGSTGQCSGQYYTLMFILLPFLLRCLRGQWSGCLVLTAGLGVCWSKASDNVLQVWDELLEGQRHGIESSKESVFAFHTIHSTDWLFCIQAWCVDQCIITWMLHQLFSLKYFVVKVSRRVLMFVCLVSCGLQNLLQVVLYVMVHYHQTTVGL